MTTIQSTGKKAKVSSQQQVHVYTGAAAAALIAGGISALVLGLMTTLAEMSAGIANMLKWASSVGPLSGKTGLSIIAGLIGWLVLNNMWKGQDYDLKKAYTITLVLIGLGFLLTFPPFFILFAAE